MFTAEKEKQIMNPKLAKSVRFAIAREAIHESNLSRKEKRELLFTVGKSLQGERKEPMRKGESHYWEFPDGTKAKENVSNNTQPRNSFKDKLLACGC